MTPRSSLAALAVVLGMSAAGLRQAQAQPCVRPSPLLVQVQARALEQLGRRPVLRVDLGASSGRGGGYFADPAVGYVIADVMTRQLAPLALERAGLRAYASHLRRLAPVTDQASAFAAQETAEGVANDLARRGGRRIRWSTPRGAAIEVVVEAAALAGYAATPGSFPVDRYVTTIASGMGAAARMGIAADALGRIVTQMLERARAIARCGPG